MYNTSINIIASIPDLNLVIDVISDYAHGKSKDYVTDKVLNQNIYGIRTGVSRGRFLRGIRNVFLDFKSDDHRAVFYSLFTHPDLLPIKKMALYFQFAINNKLFYDLSINVFLKLYHAGRSTVNKTEFASYLFDRRNDSIDMQQWSDFTIEKIASKYLTFLKKIDFLKGTVKKEFSHIMFDDSTTVYFVYLIKSLGETSPDILKNSYMPLLFLSQQNIIERLKKISLKSYFTVSTLGYEIKIDLKYSYEEIVGVIAQRDQSEIS